MKIGVLASLLETDASELLTSLKLDEGVDIVEDVRVKELVTDHFKGKVSTARSDGKGWGEKKAKEGFEKSLNEMFNVNGKIPDMLDLIKESTSHDDNGKIELYKSKYDSLSTEFETYKDTIVSKERNTKIDAKILGLIGDVNTSKKLKELAVADYRSSRNFDMNGDDILLLDGNKQPLKKDGNFVDFKEDVKTHFGGIFSFGEPGKPKPPSPEPTPGAKIKSIANLNEALLALKNAKTQDERERIQRKIKEYEN